MREVSTSSASSQFVGSQSAAAANGAVPALTLDGVTKRYGRQVAVEDLSLTVRQGETVAILGPSGAGKTTILRIVGGLLEPTAGRVLLHGVDVARMGPGPRLAGLVGMVHQQFDLVPNLSVLHNVLAGRLGSWGFWKSMLSLAWPQDHGRAIRALERVGVGGRAAQRAGRLSGGEQQRVAIARLLVQDPLIIAADEPVASLDPARAEEVVRLLVSIASEQAKTLVSSVHSVQLARAHFSRLVGLKDGRVRFDLPARQVSSALLDDLYVLEGPRSD